MIFTVRPKKVTIFVNEKLDGGLTAAQVKAKLGCDYVINGGIFELDTGKQLAQLRVDGKTLANENWGVNYGYGWDTNGLTMTANLWEFPNFIACVCLIRDGKAIYKLACPPDMTGERERTAIGLLSDGRLWLMADRAQPRSPEQLRDYALSQGCVSAVMLDGGASTQCAFPGGSLAGGRIAANYICVWSQNEKEDKPTDKKIKVYLSPSSQPANIYASGNTNEQEQCRRIAEFCRAALDRCGFDCIVGDAEIDFTGRVLDSNNWGADYHIPIHTNAGGGHGVVCFVYKDTALAKPVYDAINAIAPYKSSYGVRVDRALYEVKNTTAKCIYVEAAFHDNVAEAEWIIGHARDIGEAICKGLCKTVGVSYVEMKNETPVKEKSLTERVEALEAWAKTKGYAV